MHLSLEAKMKQSGQENWVGRQSGRLSPRGEKAEASEFRQYIRFMSCPHAQRGLRTLAGSSDSFTTSISQQHLGFTQRYRSFFFMAMIGSSEAKV
jgi:hypothetical protein